MFSNCGRISENLDRTAKTAKGEHLNPRQKAPRVGTEPATFLQQHELLQQKVDLQQGLMCFIFHIFYVNWRLETKVFFMILVLKGQLFVRVISTLSYNTDRNHYS